MLLTERFTIIFFPFFFKVVYSEQIIGYPRERYINLSCELFGIAGHFALILRSSLQSGTVIETQNKDAFLKVSLPAFSPYQHVHELEINLLP